MSTDATEAGVPEPADADGGIEAAPDERPAPEPSATAEAPADTPPRHRFMPDGPEQRLRSLPVLLDRYASALAAAMQARLRTRLPVRRDTASASSVAELHATLPSDVLHAACTLDGLPGEVWWLIDRALVAGLTDRWFGGEGACVADERALSTAERRLADALVDAAMAALVDGLAPHASVVPVRIADASAARLVRHAPAGGCVSCAFHLNTGAGEGTARLILAPSMLARLDGAALRLPPASASARGAATSPFDRARSPLATSGWLDGMRGCEIELNGVLAESTITLGDVMRLAEGDFIALDERQTVSFRVDGRDVFDASIGTVDGRASANVTYLHSPDARR